MIRSLRFSRAWLQQHPDRESLEAASMALSEAERSIVWTQQALVIELLQSAEALGEKCEQTVGFQSLQSGDIQLWDRSDTGRTSCRRGLSLGATTRRIMGELPIGSPTRRFYRELAEHSEHIARGGCRGQHFG